MVEHLHLRDDELAMLRRETDVAVLCKRLADLREHIERIDPLIVAAMRLITLGLRRGDGEIITDEENQAVQVDFLTAGMVYSEVDPHSARTRAEKIAALARCTSKG